MATNSGGTENQDSGPQRLIQSIKDLHERFARTRATTHSCCMKPRHGWGTRRKVDPEEYLAKEWEGRVAGLFGGGDFGAEAAAG